MWVDLGHLPHLRTVLGEVHLAEHHPLGRRAQLRDHRAVVRSHPHLAANGPEEKEQFQSSNDMNDGTTYDIIGYEN